MMLLSTRSLNSQSFLLYGLLLLLLPTKASASISSSHGSKKHPAKTDNSVETGDAIQVIDSSDDRESLKKFANQTAQNVTFLLDHLLQQYDNSLRPDIRGPPLVVEINMQVRSMGPISEIDMTYSMDCYFRQSWVDQRLAFSGRKNLALSIEMLRKIWKPDTYIFNGRKSYLHTITTPNKFMRLFPNGRVLYSQRLTIRASCQMDLSDFPMDKQNCPLYIGSFGYSTDDVLYRWTKGRGVNIASDMKLSQFDLIQTPTGNATTIVNKGIHSTLVVGFLLQRHMGNFVIQVYGPCVLLVVISWVSFWLNREATSDRISLGVTTVLTMTFLGLEARTDLPQVSYPTALDYFVFISFIFIFSTVVQFALVHYFTKVGAGEYYLEELEETICMAEERLKERKRQLNNPTTTDSYKDISQEDGTSLSGNSNNVFTPPAADVMMMSSSSPMLNNCMDDPIIPTFDSTIIIDPLQRQLEQDRANNGQQPFYTNSQENSFIKHNCLNHHPYGTFYYSKKTGRTGRHFPHPVAPPKVPNSPALRTASMTSSSHRTGPNLPPTNNGPCVRTNNTMVVGSNFTNFRSSIQHQHFHHHHHHYQHQNSGSSTTSSSRRRILDWAKSWKNYKKKAERVGEEDDECRCKRCITRAMNNPEKALNSVSQIDKISRIVFPLAFIALNGFYWFSYLKHSQRIDLSFESA